MPKSPSKSNRRSEKLAQEYFAKSKARHDFLRDKQTALANFRCEGCG